MSQRDGFGSGFLLGALFGGIVGGVAGAIAASQIKGKKGKNKELSEDSEWLDDEQPLHYNTEENMELARRRLENKIAQLNGAIDDVRQQMSVIHSPNGQDPS
jgi:hypothetical protein